MKNFKKLDQLFFVVLIVGLLLGCGGNSFQATDPIILDATPPTKPTLVSPENNRTTFDTNVTIQISGEINASIFVDGVDKGIDLNGSGQGTFLIDLSNINRLSEHNITLVDSSGNESDSLIFLVTRLAQPTLNSPDNNTTTYANSVDVNISGGIGASIYLDGVDTQKDINSTTGFGQLTLALGTYETKNFSITLKDSFNNTSIPLIFTITRVFDTNAAKQIKAIEMGYIKNANITGVDDKSAVYSDLTNTYTFTNPPAYPLSLVGGVVKDINLSLDINMKTGVPTVITPITTIIDKDAKMQTKFATILGIGDISENFARDYLATNDINFTKIAAISYVALKYPSITNTFISQTATNTAIASIDGYGSKLSSDINGSSLNILQKYFSSKLIDEVIKYDQNATDLGVAMRPLRYAMDGNITLLPKRVTLKTNQTICFDKANPSDEIDCSEVNASGDGNTSHRFGEVRNFERNATTNIVKDSSSRLEWQDDSGVNITKSWGDAKQYCEDLNISAKDDWYLPSIEQLNSLVDRNSKSSISILDSIFKSANVNYWSATSYNLVNNHYRYIIFSNGMTAHNEFSTQLYVRCVRDIKE